MGAWPAQLWLAALCNWQSAQPWLAACLCNWQVVAHGPAQGGRRALALTLTGLPSLGWLAPPLVAPAPAPPLAPAPPSPSPSLAPLCVVGLASLGLTFCVRAGDTARCRTTPHDRADGHGALQVGARAARVGPRCGELRLATGGPRTVGYPPTFGTRLAHTTGWPPCVGTPRRLACTTPPYRWCTYPLAATAHRQGVLGWLPPAQVWPPAKGPRVRRPLP